MKRMSKITRTLLGGGLGLLLAFALAGHAAAQTSCVLPPSGMISWWDGDSVSVTTAFDIQGGNDGTLVNGATTAPGNVGQAFIFDGIDDFVSVPDSADQKPPSITIDGWFNLTQAPSGEFYLASKYQPPGIFIGWIIRIDGSLRPAFSIHRSPNFVTTATSSVAILLDTWFHIAGTYDGTTARIYVDGGLTGSATLSGGYTPASTPMKIGTATWFTGGFMPGLADEVEIYNRALTAAEIQAIFNADIAGKCKNGVDIDIKPGSFPNSINSCSKGAIPIAILGSASLDVTNIDPATLAFAGAGIKMVGKTNRLLCSVEDVSGPPPGPGGADDPSGVPDGFDDLVCHFVTVDLADIAPGDTSAVVIAELFDGTPIEGTDSINIVKDDCLP